MYVGRIVELAETDELFSAPKHPYTAALLSAVPEPDPRMRSKRIVLQGEVANPAAPPTRLLLPSALPARGRAVPDPGAGVAGDPPSVAS